MGEVLFFASPKKSTQKKGEPEGLPAMRVSCASRNFERSPNSQNLPRLRLANPARQAGSLALKIPAMLGGARRESVMGFGPVGAAEHRRTNRGKRAPCSSPKRAQRDRRVGRAPGFAEERRVFRYAPRVRTGTNRRTAFLLVRFLWRDKENELARTGRNKPSKQPHQTRNTAHTRTNCAVAGYAWSAVPATGPQASDVSGNGL